MNILESDYTFLCQETSHADVFAQQIEAATQRKAHSVMPRIDAKLSLQRLSMVILRWPPILSPGVLLFLDRLTLCVIIIRQWETWFVLQPQHTLCVCMDYILNLKGRI